MIFSVDFMSLKCYFSSDLSYPGWIESRGNRKTLWQQKLNQQTTKEIHLKKFSRMMLKPHRYLPHSTKPIGDGVI